MSLYIADLLSTSREGREEEGRRTSASLYFFRIVSVKFRSIGAVFNDSRSPPDNRVYRSHLSRMSSNVSDGSSTVCSIALENQ